MAQRSLKTLEPPAVGEKSDPLETAFYFWRKYPTPSNLGSVLEAAAPLIRRGAQIYGNQSPLMTSRARLLLAKSLPKFDPQRGVPLKNWMYQQLQPLLRERSKDDLIPVPETVRRQLFDYKNATQQLTDELGRSPSDLEVAERMRVPVKRLQRVRAYDTRTVPVSAFVDTEGMPNLPGTDPSTPQDELMLDYLYYDLDDEKDRRLFDAVRRGDGNKSNLARELGVSPAALSQRSKRLAERVASALRPDDSPTRQRIDDASPDSVIPGGP